MSFHYSDELSELMVRAVTRVNDNKGDPNIETATYGLFTPCEQEMRNSLVREGFPHIFFVSERNDERFLVGRYRIGWWAQGPDYKGRKKKARPDVYLAASEVRMLRNPIPLTEVAARFKDPEFSKGFRTFKFKSITEKRTHQLLTLINRYPDATDEFIAEIHRLERINMRYHKARYPSHPRIGGFSWDDASLILDQKPVNSVEFTPPALPIDRTGWWVCGVCGKAIQHVGGLKQCAACRSFGSFAPA